MLRNDIKNVSRKMWEEKLLRDISFYDDNPC